MVLQYGSVILAAEEVRSCSDWHSVNVLGGNSFVHRPDKDAETVDRTVDWLLEVVGWLFGGCQEVFRQEVFRQEVRPLPN